MCRLLHAVNQKNILCKSLEHTELHRGGSESYQHHYDYIAMRRKTQREEIRPVARLNEHISTRRVS
jgi:hypothetical protein